MHHVLSTHSKIIICLKLGKKFFKQKLIINSTILNKWKSFNRIVNKWHYSLEDYIISPGAY